MLSKLFPSFSSFFSFFSSSSSSSSVSNSLSSLSSSSISSSFISSISSQIIKSIYLLSFYNLKSSFSCLQLPDQKRLFLISSSYLINQLTQLETSNLNIYTIRKQNYIYNQSLLSSNPVSKSNLNLNENYVKNQHKLFIKLSQELNFNSIILPKNQISIIGNNINHFVINLTSQIYLPMLLNVQSSKVLYILDDFIQLLDILEQATGKHNITFQDYLEHNQVQYSDILEQQYIRLFHKIVVNLTNDNNNNNNNNNINDNNELNMTNVNNDASLEELCNDIITRLSTSNIVSVLSTTMNPKTDSIVMVNNILSWLDNMLNVVNTIVNLIVLVGQQNNGIFTKEYYNFVMPQAKALATMFMRHVLEPFQITKENGYNLQFRKGDIIMMSNGKSDTIYGGIGRKCPSRPWSHSFMEKMMTYITQNYEIRYTGPQLITPTNAGCIPSLSKPKLPPSLPYHSVPPQSSDNNSWFWNKFSVQGIELHLKNDQQNI